MSYGMRAGELIDINRANRWINSYNSLSRYQVSVSSNLEASGFDPSSETKDFYIRLSSSYYRDAIVIISIHYIPVTDSSTWTKPTITSIKNFAGTSETVTLLNQRVSTFTAVDTNFQWQILSSEYDIVASGDDWYEIKTIPGHVQSEKDMSESGFKKMMILQVRDGVSQYQRLKRGDTITKNVWNSLQDFFDYDVYFSTYSDNIPKPYWRSGTTPNYFVENAEFVVKQVDSLPIFPEFARPKELDGGFVIEYEYVP